MLELVLCPTCSSDDVVKHVAELEPTHTIVHLYQWQDVEAEADEMWSFVGSKQQQRWLWHAINQAYG